VVKLAEYRNESQRMIGKGVFFSLLRFPKGADDDGGAVGMNICWDHFVNQYDTTRYVSSADGRDNWPIQFVREFASVISVLQVGTCAHLPLSRADASGRYRTTRAT